MKNSKCIHEADEHNQNICNVITVITQDSVWNKFFSGYISESITKKYDWLINPL